MTKIVLINAPPGAGKDTLANALVSQYPDYDTQIIKFSTPLKLATHAWHGHHSDIFNYMDSSIKFDEMPYVQVYGPSWFQRVIDQPQEVFFGKTPRQIYEEFGQYLKILDWNTDLRMTVHALFGLYTTSCKPWYDDETRQSYYGILKPDFFENTKNLHSHLFGGSSPRKQYIWLSENVVKPNVDNQFFGRVFCNTFDQSYGAKEKLILVPDSGFVSEAMPALEKVGVENCFLLQVYAEQRGCTFAGDSRSYINLPCKTMQIKNNDDIWSYVRGGKILINNFLGIKN